MKTPDLKALFERRAIEPFAAKIARELAGPQARRDLLSAAGYAGEPAALAARLGVELERRLPLFTGPGQEVGFGDFFNGIQTLTRARLETGNTYPREETHQNTASARLQLTPEEVEAYRPWISGQRTLRLARAYVLVREPGLAVDALRTIKDFCAYNPPLMGPGWTNQGLICRRVINWLMALRLLDGLPPFNARDFADALLSLQVAGQVLAGTLEQTGGAIRAEDAAPACALFYLGSVLEFLPSAQEWQALGARRLGPALKAWAHPRQNGSPAQAAAACLFGGLGLWLGGKLGVDLPGTAKGLAALARLCRVLAPPWGAGRAWATAPHHLVFDWQQPSGDPFSTAANLSALLLADPTLRAARTLDETLFWLWGPGGGGGLRELAGGGTPKPLYHAGAGLLCLAAISGGRRAGVVLRAPARPPGSEGAPAAQALAMSLSLDGEGVLITPGPPGSGPLSHHLGSRSAQNALVVDGVQPQGGVVNLEGLEEKEGGIFASLTYNGYGHLADPVVLRRRLFLDAAGGLLNLVDQVQARGEHLCEVLFHLPPNAEVSRVGERGFLLAGAWGEVMLMPEPKARVELVMGRGRPPLGWAAPSLGQVAPAPVVRVWAQIRGNARLSNVITWVQGPLG